MGSEMCIRDRARGGRAPFALEPVLPPLPGVAPPFQAVLPLRKPPLTLLLLAITFSECRGGRAGGRGGRAPFASGSSNVPRHSPLPPEILRNHLKDSRILAGVQQQPACDEVYTTQVGLQRYHRHGTRKSTDMSGGVTLAY